MATVDEAVALARASARVDHVGYGTTTAWGEPDAPFPDFPLHVAEILDFNPATFTRQSPRPPSTPAATSCAAPVSATVAAHG